MKSATQKSGTLKQAAKILFLFKDTPGGQIQAILASGLLADVRDANVAKVNRDEHRKVLGLTPLNLSTLTIQVMPRELAEPYEDWELVENVESPAGTLTFCLAEFLAPNEDYVKGELMRKRAKKYNWVLGEIHARALLEVRNRIPEDWRKFYLVFPGTVWRPPNGCLYVPYLYWLGGRWYLDWPWLGRDWGRHARLVRLCE